jgi:hypothetical protein
VLLLCWRLDVHITIVKYMHVLLLTYFTHIPHRSSLPSNTKLLTINLHSISCLHHCHHRIQVILWIIVDHLYFSAWILLHFVWIFLWSVLLRQLTILMTVHHCFGIVWIRTQRLIHLSWSCYSAVDYWLALLLGWTGGLIIRNWWNALGVAGLHLRRHLILYNVDVFLL